MQVSLDGQSHRAARLLQLGQTKVPKFEFKARDRTKEGVFLIKLWVPT